MRGHRLRLQLGSGIVKFPKLHCFFMAQSKTFAARLRRTSAPKQTFLKAVAYPCLLGSLLQRSWAGKEFIKGQAWSRRATLAC